MSWKSGKSLAGLTACMLIASTAAAQTSPSFSTVQRSLVIIETKNGGGSGFVAKLGGKKYVISNEHIIRADKLKKCRLLDGTTLRFSQLEVADTVDLVRMQLLDQTNNVPALEIEMSVPSMGAPVMVCGNSQGRGVATQLKGKVLGVGPDFIEVDAPFVQGNSGSPIVNARGRVEGVATFIASADSWSNWVERGTRFAQARRFGVRVNTRSITWKKVHSRTYYAQADLLHDVDIFLEQIAAVLGIISTNNQPVLDLKAARAAYRRYKDMATPVARICQDMEKHRVSIEKALQDYRPSSRNSGYRQIGGQRGSAYLTQARRFEDQLVTDLKTVWDLPMNYLAKTKWATANLKKEAAQRYRNLKEAKQWIVSSIGGR